MRGRPARHTRPFDPSRQPMVQSRPSGARRRHQIPSVGDRFGELTVRGYQVGERGGVKAVVVECSCGPGLHEVSENNLRTGKSTRCNRCARTKSGVTRKKYAGYADIVPDDAHRERLLNRVSAIFSRCENPRNRNYAGYGGRGIRVHADWRSDGGRRFFLAYLVSLPGWDDPSLDLDRIDNDRGYEPTNLRFVTQAVNARNKRQVSVLTERIRVLEACLRSCQCGAASAVHGADGIREWC
jgi:hypothetical protein